MAGGMSTVMHIGLIVLAVAAVAIGDVCLKKASLAGDFAQAMSSGWMVAAVVLYLYQIILFTYVFVAGWRLSVIGTMQTVLYAIIVIGVGILYFKESLTTGQGIGIVLAFTGVVLMNVES
jgi:EamA domain-containing membrane protein RarD